MIEGNEISEITKLGDTKIVGKIYDDAFAGAFQEFGGLLTDAVKAARLIATPIRAMGLWQDRTARWLERSIKGIPEERRIEPAPSVAGPIMLELAFMEETNPLADLYVNLLARAMDRDRAKEVHPAFVKIIGQLSPIEVMLLEFLSETEIETKSYYSHEVAFEHHQLIETLN